MPYLGSAAAVGASDISTSHARAMQAVDSSSVRQPKNCINCIISSIFEQELITFKPKKRFLCLMMGSGGDKVVNVTGCVLRARASACAAGAVKKK